MRALAQSQCQLCRGSSAQYLASRSVTIGSRELLTQTWDLTGRDMCPFSWAACCPPLGSSRYAPLGPRAVSKNCPSVASPSSGCLQAKAYSFDACQMQPIAEQVGITCACAQQAPASLTSSRAAVDKLVRLDAYKKEATADTCTNVPGC